MKTIYLVRHAKSSWQIPGLKDHERPLLEVGVERTGKITNYLIANGAKIDLIIASHAVRSWETALLIAQALGYPVKEIKEERKIYLGTDESLLDIVSGLPDDLESVMLVGHNPVISGFAQLLKARLDSDMPTSAVVCIGCETTKWNQVIMAKKEVKFYVYPKML